MKSETGMGAEGERHLNTIREQLRKDGGGTDGKKAAAGVEYVNDGGHTERQTRDRGEVNLIETPRGFQGAGEDNEWKHEALDKAGEKEKRFKVGKDIAMNGEEAGNGADGEMSGENDEEAGAEIIVERGGDHLVDFVLLVEFLVLGDVAKDGGADTGVQEAVVADEVGG
jgi:hypothetical protein